MMRHRLELDLLPGGRGRRRRLASSGPRRRQPQGRAGLRLRRRARHQGRRPAFVAAGGRRGRGRGGRRGRRVRPSSTAVAYLRVADARRALALAAARFYPRQPETVVAVTGTSGKSSVADFVAPDLRRARPRGPRASARSASITSAGAAYGSLTTPDPIALHGPSTGSPATASPHLAMEASSHGIDQRRLDGVRLTAAGFTNLGRDHLDYHGTIEAYARPSCACSRTCCRPAAPAVINADGAYAERVPRRARAERGLRMLTTGRAGDGAALLEARAEGFAQDLRLELSAGPRRSVTPAAGRRLPGRERARRRRARARDRTGERRRRGVLPRFADLKGVPGRLERVGEVDGALVLRRLRPQARRAGACARRAAALRARAASSCVFGCGGDRDRGKRPMMGAIAAEKADVVDRHRRQSAQRGPGRDPRRDPGGRARRARDRRPRRGDPRRGARACSRRRARRGRQGP